MPSDNRAEPPGGSGALAIDHHVGGIDGSSPVHRYLPQAGRRGGGPLAEITLYRIKNSPYRGVSDHWHLVTKGLSELDSKISERADLSGWGFELSLRVSGDSGIRPQWAVDLLTNVAGYVWSENLPMGPGHLLDLRRPVVPDSPLSGALVVLDPGLGGFVGPNGAMEFLQLFPLSAAELELCDRLAGLQLGEMVARENPLMVCDVDRPELLADPRFAAEAHLRAQGDRLAGPLRVGRLSVSQRRLHTTLTIGKTTAATIGRAVSGLVGEGASLLVIGPATELRLVVAEEATWENGGGRLSLFCPQEQMAELRELLLAGNATTSLAAYQGLRLRITR